MSDNNGIEETVFAAQHFVGIMSEIELDRRVLHVEGSDAVSPVQASPKRRRIGLTIEGLPTLAI